VPNTIDEFLPAWVATRGDLFLLVGKRVTPWQAVRADTEPRITFTLTSGDDVKTTKGPSGLNRQRYDVVCWGLTAAIAKRVARLVKGTRGDKRLNGFQGTLVDVKMQAALLLDERDVSEQLTPGSDAGAPGINLDFEFWWEEVPSA
jgi:hypothetical protein